MSLLVPHLPPPLLAAGKRWDRHGGLRHRAAGLAKIVTTFTLGHSLTLIVGALGWLRLPALAAHALWWVTGLALFALLTAYWTRTPPASRRDSLSP